jgi:hypothetical protein
LAGVVADRPGAVPVEVVLTLRRPWLRAGRWRVETAAFDDQLAVELEDVVGVVDTCR